MNADSLVSQERRLARLIGAATVFALLVAAILLVVLEDFRWAALVLALSAGLTGALALLLVRATRESGASQEPETPEPSVDREAESIGLPVHPISGLYRPWIFHERLAEETARAQRYQHGFALVLLEPANRLIGTEAGVYAPAAKALRQALRDCDFAAHFDDERFAVLLPETEMEGAQVAGRRLLGRLGSASESRLRWRGALVTYPEDATDANTLIDHAHILLRRGRLESTVRSVVTKEPQPFSERRS